MKVMNPNPARMGRRYTRPALLGLILVGVLLVLIAGLRSGDGNPDLNTYREWYYGNMTFNEYTANPAFIFIKDPGYFLLTAILNDFGVSFEIFILMISLICVSFKIRSINILSNAPFYSILIYISSYFILQEMIQIRAGIASGLFLLSLPFLARRKLIIYTLFIILAISFHYSAIIFLPLIFLTDKNEHPNYYLALLFISILGAMTGITLDAIIIHLSWVDPRVMIHIESTENNFTVNIFNRVSILDLMLAITLLVNFENCKRATPYASYIIRIFIISQILFYALSGIAVFAFRLSGLMSIVEIMAWPLLLPLIKSTRTRMILFSTICIVLFSATLRNFGN